MIGVHRVDRSAPVQSRSRHCADARAARAAELDELADLGGYAHLARTRPEMWSDGATAAMARRFGAEAAARALRMPVDVVRALAGAR